MNDTDCAWAAGFIDGEGTIGLYKKGSMREMGASPLIRVTNTDPRPLHELRRLFGGYVKPNYPKTGNRRPQWVWSLFSSEAIALALEAMLPYLKVKDAQAVLVLGWIRLLMNPNKTRQKHSDENVRTRSAYMTKIRELNRTGLVDAGETG